MDRTRVVIGISVILLLLTLIVYFVWRNTLIELVLLPFLYIIWLAKIIFNAIPQIVYWSVFIIISLVLLFRNLSIKPFLKRTKNRREARIEMNQRAAFWESQIQRNADLNYRDAYTLFEFKKLIVSIIAYQKNLSDREVEPMIKKGELDIPDEWVEFTDVGDYINFSYESFPVRMLKWIKSMLVSPDSASREKFNKQLEKLINSLESYLEVHRGPRNQTPG